MSHPQIKPNVLSYIIFCPVYTFNQTVYWHIQPSSQCEIREISVFLDVMLMYCSLHFTELKHVSRCIGLCWSIKKNHDSAWHSNKSSAVSHNSILIWRIFRCVQSRLYARMSDCKMQVQEITNQLEAIVVSVVLSCYVLTLAWNTSATKKREECAAFKGKLGYALQRRSSSSWRAMEWNWVLSCWGSTCMFKLQATQSQFYWLGWKSSSPLLVCCCVS